MCICTCVYGVCVSVHVCMVYVCMCICMWCCKHFRFLLLMLYVSLHRSNSISLLTFPLLSITLFFPVLSCSLLFSPFSHVNLSFPLFFISSLLSPHHYLSSLFYDLLLFFISSLLSLLPSLFSPLSSFSHTTIFPTLLSFILLYSLRQALKTSSKPHDAAIALNLSEVRYHIARLAVSIIVYLLVATGNIF